MVIPDKDILADLPLFGFGVKQVLKKELNWMVRQFHQMIEARKDNLKKIRPGALLPFDTKIIRVKMIARPTSTNAKLVQLLKLRRKLNETLEECLTKFTSMRVMNLQSMTDCNLFNEDGSLTQSGKI